MKADELFNLYLVTLISSDNNYDINTCKANLSRLNALKDKLTKSEQIKKVEEGINIVENDLENFNERNNL